MLEALGLKPTAWQQMIIEALNFEPRETPMGVPVVTCFEVRGRVFVADVDGRLFHLLAEGDDPDLWCWEFVTYLA